MMKGLSSMLSSYRSSSSSLLWGGGACKSALFMPAFPTASQVWKMQNPSGWRRWRMLEQKRRKHTDALGLGNSKGVITDLFHTFAQKYENQVVLRRSDLRPLLRAIGEIPSEKKLDEIMAYADKDRNGVIDLDEFLESCDLVLKRSDGGKINDISDLDTIIDTFRTLDADGDGLLSVNDIKGLLSTTGTFLSHEEAEQIISVCDIDGNNGIDLGEFLHALIDSTLSLRSWRLRSAFRCVLVFGGPGCGKGTLCDMMRTRMGVEHISTGDMLREEVATGSPLGMQIKDTMERGELVDASTVLALLRLRMANHPGSYVLLDGFPRSEKNAMDFTQLCGKPDFVINMKCPDDVMVERMMKRSSYSCRADDNVETAMKRIETFHSRSSDALVYLEKAGIEIIDLDARLPPELVFEQFLEAKTPFSCRYRHIEARKQRLRDSLRFERETHYKIIQQSLSLHL